MKVRFTRPALTDLEAVTEYTAPYPYLIFYEVTESDIVIHAVRHGARDPGSMPDAS